MFVPGMQPCPPGTPPGPAFCPPEPQPTPLTQPPPPGPPPGPLNWPPEPQLPLASQPPPPGSCLYTLWVGPAVAGEPTEASAAATGITAIAAAAAPPITSGFMKLSFSNMVIDGVYPLPHMPKTSSFSRGDSQCLRRCRREPGRRSAAGPTLRWSADGR